MPCGVRLGFVEFVKAQVGLRSGRVAKSEQKRPRDIRRVGRGTSETADGPRNPHGRLTYGRQMPDLGDTTAAEIAATGILYAPDFLDNCATGSSTSLRTSQIG
jgi:hypothetical protein